MVSIAQENRVDPATSALIADAVRNADLTQFSAWSDLDALSTNTQLDDIEIFEDEIFRDGKKFKGNCNFYIVLNFGQGDDAVVITESFSGTFEGHLDAKNRPTIDDIHADTSSFTD